MDTRNLEKEKRIAKLVASSQIEIIGTEISNSTDIKELKKQALEYGKGLRGEYTNKDTEINIGLSRPSIKEVLNHDYKDISHLQSIAAIPQIIENMIYIDEEMNEDKETHATVEKYLYFVSGLKIGAQDFTVKSVIAEDIQGNRYYDHKLTPIEKGLLVSSAHRIATPEVETVALSDKVLSITKDKRLLKILQGN